MLAKKQVRIFSLLTFIVALGYSAASVAASAVFEKDYAIDNNASIEISNGSGSVDVRGADVDQVTIRARIKIDKRYTRRDGSKAKRMLLELRAKPPISVDGDRIVIDQPKSNAQRRYASISYEIVVPRDAQVKVQSESGDVRVSGVSGDVDASSESGVVTLANIRFENKDNVQVATR